MKRVYIGEVSVKESVYFREVSVKRVYIREVSVLLS
jgi:hypothetical protein